MHLDELKKKRGTACSLVRTGEEGVTVFYSLDELHARLCMMIGKAQDLCVF